METVERDKDCGLIRTVGCGDCGEMRNGDGGGGIKNVGCGER